jgi:RHS repeat-associated protein
LLVDQGVVAAEACPLGADTYTYGYDSDGNRTSTAINGTTSRNTYWDINNPIPQIATETTGAGTLIADYHPDPLGDPAIDHTSADEFYDTHDWLGSVTDLTDSTGVDQQHTSYDTFGTPTVANLVATPPANPFGYTGGYTDPNQGGTLNLNARTYTPATGTLTSTDPYTCPTNKPVQSTYGYTDNEPTYHTDPSGQCLIICGAIIGAVVGAGIYTFKHYNDPHFSWTGLAEATGEGALIGAGAAFLLPATGVAVADGLGLEGITATGTRIGVNSAVGARYA